MKVKLEVELDTEKQKDLDMIEDVIYHLQDVREILEEHQENLREQRLRQKELDRIRSLENIEKQVDQNITKNLEDFNIDKTSEN